MYVCLSLTCLFVCLPQDEDYEDSDDTDEEDEDSEDEKDEDEDESSEEEEAPTLTPAKKVSVQTQNSLQ